MIYAGMAFAYMQYANLGIEHEKNIKQAEEFVKKALDIDNELSEAQVVLGGISVFREDMITAIYHWAKAYAGKPEDPEIMLYLSLGYSVIGQNDAGRILAEKCVKIDPINPLSDAIIGWNHFFGGRFDLALDPILSAYDLTPESVMNQFWKALILFYNDRADEAYEFISRFVQEPGSDINTQVTIFLKYVIRKDSDKLTSLLTPDFVKAIKRDFQLSYHVATFFSYLDDKKKSLEFLENAVNHGFIDYPLLNDYDKLLNNIRGEERFIKLMERVKYEWENFDV